MFVARGNADPVCLCRLVDARIADGERTGMEDAFKRLSLASKNFLLVSKPIKFLPVFIVANISASWRHTLLVSCPTLSDFQTTILSADYLNHLYRPATTELYGQELGNRVCYRFQDKFQFDD